MIGMYNYFIKVVQVEAILQYSRMNSSLHLFQKGCLKVVYVIFQQLRRVANNATLFINTKLFHYDPED